MGTIRIGKPSDTNGNRGNLVPVTGARASFHLDERYEFTARDDQVDLSVPQTVVTHQDIVAELLEIACREPFSSDPKFAGEHLVSLVSSVEARDRDRWRVRLCEVLSPAPQIAQGAETERHQIGHAPVPGGPRP